MTRYSLAATAAALMLSPAMVSAQPLPAPVIAVVNVEQIFETCTQCTAANTQLQAQGTQLQQRAQQLGTQIQTEANALQPLVNALNGAQPDAALATRIQTYQTMQQNAEREIAAGRERIERNVAFVRQQIGQRLRPAITTVMQQRGATVVLNRSSLIDAAPTLDITAAVLAIVNQNTTPLNVNAPAQQQQPQQPGATPAARPQQPAQQQQQPRPRPQGR